MDIVLILAGPTINNNNSSNMQSLVQSSSAWRQTPRDFQGVGGIHVAPVILRLAAGSKDFQGASGIQVRRDDHPCLRERP